MGHSVEDRAFGAFGVNVNAIRPGMVATDMWKLIGKGFRDKDFSDKGPTRRDNGACKGFAADILPARPSRTDDPVGGSVFLAASGSDYMTGQNPLVDRGMELI